MAELVSIILPVFNSAKYLEEALNSCLNQTYSNIEIIVIDGNSTDGTLAILEKFSDQITILSESKKGIGLAINRGIKAMKGTWFKIMNADDILYPECIEILVSEAHKLKQKKVIIHGDCDVIDSDGKIIDEWLRPDFKKLKKFDLNVILLDHNIIVNITSILHRDVFQMYGYYDETTIAEDYEMWLRLCILYDFSMHVIQKKLVMYRMHDSNTSLLASKKSPKYMDHARNLIFQKLDPLKRKKYEAALQILKKQKSLKARIKNKAKKIISRFF